MSRLLAATLLLSAVSIAHTQDCVRSAPDATDGAVVGPKITKLLTKIRTSAYPGGDAGREIVSRCHHDRIF
jgi:hypothetical protein